MKNPNIKIGDLLKLEGLEKPQDGVLKMKLPAGVEKSPKLDQFGNNLSELAEKVEYHGDVKTGEVTALLESMKKSLTKELSLENAAKLLTLLKKRFENKSKPYKSAEGVSWKDVRAKLETSPEKLWSLYQMEDTGGEPDLIEYDKETGEYVFMDCSPESPAIRLNCVYDRAGEEILKSNNLSESCNGNAVSKAALMGVDLLTEKEYRDLQTKGEFDKSTWSWLKTPIDQRKKGIALHGFRSLDTVVVREAGSSSHIIDKLAFRVALRLK